MRLSVKPHTPIEVQVAAMMIALIFGKESGEMREDVLFQTRDPLSDQQAG